MEPIPPNRICQACGLVTRVTTFLPCLHVFCKMCYEQCQSGEEHCCPFDGQRVQKGDAEWRELPADNLLKRMVKCWNEDRGCDTILVASELNKHFSRDCDHHSTSCSRCSSLVLCRNMFAHIQSECKEHVVSLKSGAAHKITSDQKEIIMALNAGINERVAKIERGLDQVVSENTAQSYRLVEISHCMNAMKETLLEISSRSHTLENAASSSAAIYETLVGQNEKLHELAGTIKSSNETLNGALEGTKLSVEQLKENTENSLKAQLSELFSGEGGVLRKPFERNWRMPRRQSAANTQKVSLSLFT
ncbi:E3 ubiquitin-protein ligase PDZRN3-B [Rhipicephalus sanguineus]|uniref:E3 ubiquitin-protein ligase PDZRN3-B n=1 Tax=Rhipicephalus sanguineus TaxID=34632 RepID=UPI001893D35D|nr:E3 ubiquitin-protein ligase PDZRN3-B [Rhipicephalus sanguineus]